MYLASLRLFSTVLPFKTPQAIQLDPQDELYKETLALFQMNAECYSRHLQKDKQGLSYASITRANSGIVNEKEKNSSAEWNAKKAKVKENPCVKTPWSPAVSSSYYSDPCEQATIENPWASFVNSSYKKRKNDTSPIDGLSEIEIPPMNDNYCTENQSPKSEVVEEADGSFCSTFKTPISSQEAMHDNGSFSDHEPDDHVGVSADHFGYKNGEYPEGVYTYSSNEDENLEARFIDELCMARESALDDWAKYYDLLQSGLREEGAVPFTRSDILHQNIPTTHQYSDSLDELDETVNVKHRDQTDRRSSSDKPSFKDNSEVCSKCGHTKEGRNLSHNRTKTRIHFVNGACVSSPSNPCCTCNKQNKGYSEEQSSKPSLSSSQQEFYRNLQNYFGNGKVKSRKTDIETEKEKSKKNCAEFYPGPTTKHNSHDSNVSSNTTKELPKVRSEQNVTEDRECSANSGLHKSNQNAKEHLSNKVNSEMRSDDTSVDPETAKSSFNKEGTKKGKKSFGKERSQQTSFKPKSRVDEKVRSKLKTSVKTEHIKTSKDGTSHRADSHRQAKPKAGIKSRVSDRVKAEDTAGKVPASVAKEKPNHKQRAEGTAQAEVDFTKLFYSLYCTGIV